MHTFPSELIWSPRLLWFKLELVTVEEETDVFEILPLLASPAPLPADVVLSLLFCVPGSAGKSSLLIVNSVVSEAGVFMIPTVSENEIRRLVLRLGTSNLALTVIGPAR